MVKATWLPGRCRAVSKIRVRSTRAEVDRRNRAGHLHSQQLGDTLHMSSVWSCNEWDRLEEVIVGNPLHARFPTPDRSTQLAEFPDRSLAEIPRGPFPKRVIEETEEDLNEFVQVLEKLGITVKRPETWPHEATFSTIHWE